MTGIEADGIPAAAFLAARLDIAEVNFVRAMGGELGGLRKVVLM